MSSQDDQNKTKKEKMMVAEQSETMDGGQQEETAAETKRKREEVLDNAHEEKEDQEVSAKRSKITKEETKEDDDEGPTKDEIGNGNTAEEKPVATNQIDGEKEEATELASSSSPSKGRLKNQKRWRAHQMTEDYVSLASSMMLQPTTQLGPYGYEDNYAHQGDGENGIKPRQQYPLELVSSLGYLKSPLRRPTVIEKWSPYEIALFEAGISHFGKDFFQIHKVIQSKSTKEVVDFYYVWKKTSHYKNWKQKYVPPGEIVSDGEGEVVTPVKKPPAK